MQVYECIFSLITGVGVFILAMKIMSDSLKEIAGDRMKTLLEKLASNRVSGILIGALVTAIIQSSSATTVMVIGFVNADVMTLKQAASIIIGSNIGTTATGLLASLESLNVSLYLSMLVFVGVMLSFIKKLKKIANLLTGLGMIFVGLKLMSTACNDDSIKDAFSDILQKINFPLLLEFLGMIFTAIIQSSSAMTGIIIVMVGNDVMGMDNGLFITLGANVGTCITALIGIIGANINSKRTAVIHLTFNFCGCLLFTPILWVFKKEIIDILKSFVDNPSMQIAYFHLFFNIFTALITMPFIDCLVHIAISVVKDEKPDRLIVETMEEKEKFAIRDHSTTIISIDDFNSSKNLNDKTIDFTSSYVNSEDIKYEPPNILDDYIDYFVKNDRKGKNNKKQKIKNDNDEEIENIDDNKDNDKFELMLVKEEINNEKIEENIKRDKNAKNIKNINIEGDKKIEEKIDKKKKKENNYEQLKNNDGDNKDKLNGNEKQENFEDKLKDKDIKENNIIKNDEDKKEIKIDKHFNRENKEDITSSKDNRREKELKIDKNFKNEEEIKNDEIEKFEEEKDCEKIKVNIQNEET